MNRQQRFLGTLAVAIMTAAVAGTSYRMGTGCAIECDEDRCLWTDVFGTCMIIDTSKNFAGNPVYCPVEFWDAESEEYYGYGVTSNKNCRYRLDEGCDTGAECKEFGGVATLHETEGQCSGTNWDGNVVVTCYNKCSDD